jgi:peptide/nickel transport system substrate-binding protein
LRIRRLAATAATVAAGALILSGCAAPQSEIVEGTSLSVAWNQAFYGYNGNTSDANATANNNIIYLTNDSFNYYDSTPKLVQDKTFGSYEKVSEDPLTVKYTLADGVKWSDGTPLDASDLLLSWAANSGHFNNVEPETDDEGNITNQAAIDAGVLFDSAAIGTGLDLVTDIPKVSDDNKSITLVYSKPFVDWETAFSLQLMPAHVTYQHAFPDEKASAEDAKKKVLDAIENSDTDVLGPVSAFWSHGFDMVDMPSDPSLVLSSGPYVISDLKKDEYITLKANPNYNWGGERTASIETVTIRFIPDALASVQALQNGEISITSPQSTADILTALQGVDGVTTETTADSTYEHIDLVFNNGGPFDPATYGGDADKAKLVRQAFLKTIPRADILDKLIKPLNPDAVLDDSQTVFPGADGYDKIIKDNGSAAYADVDIEGAKALLAEAGLSTVDVKFMYGKSNTRRANEYQLIAESAAKAGINVIDAGNDDWGSKLGDGSYDAVLFGWQSTSLAVTSSQATFDTTGGNNLNGYSNAKVDDLYTQLSGEYDRDKQTDILLDVEKELWEDAYGVTIFQFPGVTAYDSSVSGVVPAPLAPMFFWNFWQWKLK